MLGQALTALLGKRALPLTRRQVDLAETKKVGDYYISNGCDDRAMAHYLELMATQPPPRSRRSQHHYKNLRDIWRTWRSNLSGKDKARAWGWGVRAARILRTGR